MKAYLILATISQVAVGRTKELTIDEQDLKSGAF